LRRNLLYTGCAQERPWLGAVALCMLTAFGSPAVAQGWKPDKLVEIAVPTTPGGSVDLTARLIQKILQDGGLVKVPVTVVNKPGGGGAVSLVYLNQHAGDGHFLATNTPNIIANDINGRTPVRYTEITPLATMADQYTAVAVRADSPLRTGQDMIDRLRKDPGSLAVSTPTTLGSINHLSYALVARAAGIDVKKLKAVILGSGSDGATAVLGGHVDAHVGTTSSVIRMVEAGKLRVLAIAAPKRLGPPYEGTPTWTEQGYPVVLGTWRGVIGPRGMTREQIAFWDEVFAKVVASETWMKALRDNSWEANYLDSDGTKKLFEADYAQYRSILADLGMLKEK
jgi:putative tricarboxylic transport membrane protein